MHRILPMLQQKASETKTGLWIIEKDYAISYLLSAIFKVPLLKQFLVLKGGTALRKAYFNNFRFSEDLDFSSHPKSNAAEIRESISIAVNIMQQDLQERGHFLIQSEPLTLQEPHPRKQIAHTIRVQFPYHREPLCRLKIEITIDEPLLLTAAIKPILHEYDEALETKINVYPLTEIVSEKYRALIQSLARLQDKGWGANRVCRDYYDLWWILKKVDLSTQNIPFLVKQKCTMLNVNYESKEKFFDELLINVAKTEWEKLLIPFIPHPTPFEIVSQELIQFTQALWRSEN